MALAVGKGVRKPRKTLQAEPLLPLTSCSTNTGEKTYMALGADDGLTRLAGRYFVAQKKVGVTAQGIEIHLGVIKLKKKDFPALEQIQAFFPEEGGKLVFYIKCLVTPVAKVAIPGMSWSLTEVSNASYTTDAEV
ncbi:MAG: hypothetical protein NTW50_04815 [Candidatus Berkelbacteria bacterium]|nr:hypothetical protein [Candidatus Berkelbacteria bacterium]